jgi:hypothetical protein
MSEAIAPPRPGSRNIDLAVAWKSLKPETQAELGMAAIAMGLAHLVNCVEEHELASWRTAAEIAHGNGYDAAALEALHVFAGSAEAYVLGGDIRRLRPPALAALGVRQCSGCGCTDRCGCSEGCHWVGPFTCSSCGEGTSHG